MAYASIALEGSGISQMEEFGLLITLHLQPDLRKTNLIYANIQVLSSANMLHRLIKRGFVLGYADHEEKRPNLTSNDKKTGYPVTGRQ